MAVRFDASTDWYSRTTGLGTVSAFSVSCWVKLSADRNNYSTPWSLTNSGGSGILVQTDSDGTSLMVYQQGNGQLGSSRALTVGTWYWVGFVINGANGSMYTRALTDTSVTTTSWTTATTPHDVGTLRLGESIVGGEWLNGCLAAWKFWTAALTLDELVAESWFYEPLRTDQEKLRYRFVNDELTDHSGNGGTLTAGGTAAATEDGPPILWTPQRSARRAIVVTDVTTGALAGTLPDVTGSFAATTITDGALAGTLPAPVGAFTGDVGIPGVLAGELPAPVAALTADTYIVGALAGQLPVPTASITAGAAIEGVLAGTLPAPTAQLVGAARTPPLIAGTPVPRPAVLAGDPVQLVGVRAGTPTRA